MRSEWQGGDTLACGCEVEYEVEEQYGELYYTAGTVVARCQRHQGADVTNVFVGPWQETTATFKLPSGERETIGENENA